MAKKKKKRAKDRKAPVMSALTSWINYISILKMSVLDLKLPHDNEFLHLKPEKKKNNLKLKYEYS